MAFKICAICKKKKKNLRTFYGVRGEGVCQKCRLEHKMGEYADRPPAPNPPGKRCHKGY